MIIEAHKGTVRIQTRSSDRRTPKIRYATNMPLVRFESEWQNSDKEALDILKNRYAELKEIGKNLAKKQGGYEKPPDNSILLFNNKKIGRNELLREARKKDKIP